VSYFSLDDVIIDLDFVNDELFDEEKKQEKCEIGI
jgi:hypothetical protein